jgi:ABC-2 type transport system ATP-binding protein
VFRGRGKPDVVALQGLDLAVPRGVCFGLLGPNGAGKTTAVSILEGLLAPTAGDVFVLGERWGKSDAKLRQAIGVTLQETRLPDRLSARETLQLFASFYRESADADEVLQAISLADKAGARVADLSGGQRQRLVFGCAIVGKPELLFLDEPTANLDPNSRREVWGLIRRFQQGGGTVLLTTHYMEEAERLCDLVAVIDGGRIISEGTPGELAIQFGGEHVIEFALSAGAELLPADLTGLPHVTRCRSGERRDDGGYRLASTKPEATLPALIQFLQSTERVLGPISTRRATLDDVFVALTGQRLEE